MDDNLHYVVVGGVNGAGKSTIYEFDTIRIEGLKTDRINADEILQRNGGNWKNTTDVAKSMRQVVKDIKQHFEDRKSFHHETTFAGNTRPHEKRLFMAKSLGYNTSLIYVDKVLLGMFLSLKTLYRKRTVIWPFYFYTIIRTLSICRT